MIDTKKLYILIGRQVRDYRSTANLTQTQLAMKLGLTRTSITNIEKGIQRTPLHVIYKLCVYFDLDLSKFLPAITDVTKEVDEKRIVHIGNKTEKTGEKTAAVIEKLTETNISEKTAAILADCTKLSEGISNE